MQKRHRIFIAINLPQDVKKFLTGYEKKWAELPAKWVNAENLHITLVFLGDLTDEELGEVCIIAKEVVKNHHAFDITLNKVSYGPARIATQSVAGGPDNKIPPRFIWASGDQSKESSLLKKDLEDVLLEKVRFVPENRGFAPHVTLARISTFSWRTIEPEERPEVNEDIDMIFNVESIEVMESELKRGGPQYTIIESHNLR